MSIFDVCGFEIKPVDKDVYLTKLSGFLKSDTPPTVTTKDEALAAELQAKLDRDEPLEEGEQADGGDTGTTPLHRICERVEANDPSQVDLALEMIDVLFQFGANWVMLDDNNETPGCIALRRGVPTSIYDKFVAAGVRSEVFLHKITEDAEHEENEDDDDDDDDDDKEGEGEGGAEGDAAADQQAYLKADLEYTDTSLLTRGGNDGVMMEWETPIMQRSAELLCSTWSQGEGGVVLNVGFGMGIIDRIIQSHSPKRHYIAEAHPAVLAKMREGGWYDMPNVTVLEGRWQDTVPNLISQGEYFDGIYYDTFSEHYSDLMDFVDNVVGLLTPTGVFSYFNGLGADRQVCYDVYCQVAEMEMGDYGLKVEFEPMDITDDSGQEIRHKYWALAKYQLPKVQFMDM